MINLIIYLFTKFHEIIIEVESWMKVGWIGTGVMGLSMCKHLLNAQYSLSIYTRTAEKAKPLLELGAEWLSPHEMAANVDVLFLMLGFPRDVEAMCLGENGILRHMKKG
jgi:3-hydroxyisobutyrate dehydrogenase